MCKAILPLTPSPSVLTCHEVTDKLDDVRANAAALPDGVDDGGKAREGGSEEGREGRVSVCSTIARETRLGRESGSKEGGKGGRDLLVIGEDEVGGLLGHVAPVLAHGDTHVSRLERFTPSPGKERKGRERGGVRRWDLY